MTRGITRSKLGAFCWCGFDSSRIGIDEGWCVLDRSGTSTSGEGRSVIFFCGRAFWCHEL